MRSTIIALVASLFAITAAQAAETPTKPAALAKTEPAKAASKALTLSEIGDMLDGLGYNPTPIKNTENKVTGYTISLKSGTWTFTINVGVTADLSDVLFMAILGTNTTEDAVPMEAVLELLIDNGNIFPAIVLYTKDSKTFHLAKPTVNEKVTPSLMRSRLETFATTAREVLEKFNKIKAEKAAAGQATARVNK